MCIFVKRIDWFIGLSRAREIGGAIIRQTTPELSLSCVSKGKATFDNIHMFLCYIVRKIIFGIRGKQFEC